MDWAVARPAGGIWILRSPAQVRLLTECGHISPVRIWSILNAKRVSRARVAMSHADTSELPPYKVFAVPSKRHAATLHPAGRAAIGHVIEKGSPDTRLALPREFESRLSNERRKAHQDASGSSGRLAPVARGFRQTHRWASVRTWRLDPLCLAPTWTSLETCEKLQTMRRGAAVV